MKRSGPPKRKTPMPRPTSEMKRTSTLKAGAGLLRRSRINPVSKKQRARINEVAAVREFLVQVNGPWCQIQSPVCTGREQGVHHLCKRSQGGCDHPHNLKLACNACNGYVEDRPAWARRWGHVLSRPSCAVPESGRRSA